MFILLYLSLIIILVSVEGEWVYWFPKDDEEHLYPS